MLRVYLGALISTALLMSVATVFFEGLVWVTLTSFHAPKAVITGGEVIALVGLLIGAVFVFKMTFKTERELLETSAS